LHPIFLFDLIQLIGGDVGANDIFCLGQPTAQDGADQGGGHLAGTDKADSVHAEKLLKTLKGTSKNKIYKRKTAFLTPSLMVGAWIRQFLEVACIQNRYGCLVSIIPRMGGQKNWKKY
jgi:hypothetical protein